MGPLRTLFPPTDEPMSDFALRMHLLCRMAALAALSEWLLGGRLIARLGPGPDRWIGAGVQAWLVCVGIGVLGAFAMLFVGGLVRGALRRD